MSGASDEFDPLKQLLLQRFQTLLADPASPIGEVDETFLRLEGEQLWLDATEHFQQNGRGAMMVDLRNPQSGVDVFYLPYALILADLPPEQTEHGLGRALQHYDPQHEAIVVFWHRHGSTFYRLGEGASA